MSLYRQQKHVARLIYFKDKLTHAEPLFKKRNALNVYQLNIFQTLNFIYKTKHQLVPSAVPLVILQNHFQFLIGVPFYGIQFCAIKRKLS